MDMNRNIKRSPFKPQKAVILKPFAMVQWHGEDYSYHQDDADENTFNKGDEVIVLHEATPNPMGRLYVVFSEKINESAVVSESYIEFV